MKGSVEPSVYVVRDSMPTEKWCTQARASLHSYSSRVPPPCGVRVRVPERVCVCVPLCSLSGEGAPSLSSSLSLSLAWTLRVSALPLSVCPLSSSLSLLVLSPRYRGGVCWRWLAFFTRTYSLAFLRVHSGLLSCFPCRFGTLSLSCFPDLLSCSLSLALFLSSVGTCFLHLLSSLLVLAFFTRFLTGLLSCLLTLAFSLCTCFLVLCLFSSGLITFQCLESFAVVRSYSHPSSTRSLNLSLRLVPCLLVRFSLSY